MWKQCARICWLLPFVWLASSTPKLNDEDGGISLVQMRQENNLTHNDIFYINHREILLVPNFKTKLDEKTTQLKILKNKEQKCEKEKKEYSSELLILKSQENKLKKETAITNKNLSDQIDSMEEELRNQEDELNNLNELKKNILSLMKQKNKHESYKNFSLEEKARKEEQLSNHILDLEWRSIFGPQTRAAIQKYDEIHKQQVKELERIMLEINRLFKKSEKANLREINKALKKADETIDRIEKTIKLQQFALTEFLEEQNNALTKKAAEIVKKQGQIDEIKQKCEKLCTDYTNSKESAKIHLLKLWKKGISKLLHNCMVEACLGVRLLDFCREDIRSQCPHLMN